MSMKPILLDETGQKMVEALNRIADKSGGGGSIELAPTLDGNEVDKAPSVKAVNEGLETTIRGKLSPNLFDKNAVTVGYYVAPGTGGLIESANYCASDFIPVEAGKTYSIYSNSNSAFYDANKKHLSPGGSNNPFTAPTNACYYRCTMSVGALDKFSMNEGGTLLPYEEYGKTYLTMDSFGDSVMNELKEAFDEMAENEVKVDEDCFSRLRAHLMNPFVKTQITLIGDSITEGVGGTGYSAEGDLIPSSSHKMNALTATCWSNMLYHYINEQYSKVFCVRVDDTNITYNSYVNFTNSLLDRDGLKLNCRRAVMTNNKVLDNAVQFSFYGDRCSLQYVKSVTCGIFNVFVDGALYASVDCYAETDTFDNIFDITGLTESEHTVSIGLTNMKNDAASHANISFTGFFIKKVAVVNRYGIGGTQSAGAYNAQRLAGADFVIAQYGTNDRHMNLTPDNTTANLIDLVQKTKDNIGAETILMCSCPADARFESSDDVVRYYHMWDVKNAVAKAARHFGMPYIDNYDAFLRYVDTHNLTIDDLLADGLHPNDLGYKVMFENIMRTLGLPLIAE